MSAMSQLLSQYTSVSAPPYVKIETDIPLPYLQFSLHQFPHANLAELEKCSGEIQRLSGNRMLLMLAELGGGMIYLYNRAMKPAIPGTSGFTVEDAMGMLLETITGAAAGDHSANGHIPGRTEVTLAKAASA